MKKVLNRVLFFVFFLNINPVFAQSVVSVTPVQNALNVSKSTDISVTFDQDMDASTINSSAFIVHSLQKGLHAGIYSYSSGTYTATFDPDSNFNAGDIVSVFLTTGIENASGDTLTDPFGWSFTIEVDSGTEGFAERVTYYAGNGPSSVFSSDLDGNGDMDLAIANGLSDSVSVFLNNGDGTFATKVFYVVVGHPYSLFSSDLDGDGDMDLAVASRGTDNVSVLLNNGNGTFAPKVDYAAGDYPVSVFSTDLDGDGDMDLAVANYFSDDVSVLLNNGDGTFAPKVDYAAGDYPVSVFSTDLDSDGNMDLAVANLGSDNVSILLNNGDGIFAARVDYAVGESPNSVFSSDLDGDGDMDLAVTNRDDDDVSILLNNGNGTFAPKVDYAAGDYPVSVFSSDLDGDGDMDLAVANYVNISVLLNNGDGTFAANGNYYAGERPVSVFSSDLDGDGDMDLAVAAYTFDDLSVLWNISSVITVTSPNGGEEWQADSTYFITWTSKGTSGIVKIEYSINNGSSWTEIIGNMPDVGIYPWLIPADSPSNNCFVMVSDTNGSLSDASDAVFSISPVPIITVTSPNGGEEWKADSACFITWTSIATSGTVKIEYSIDNGSIWTEIIAGMPDFGVIYWIVPNTPSDSCLVSITDGVASDTSDAVFSILPTSGIPDNEIPNVYSMNLKTVSIDNKLEVRYALPVRSCVKFSLYDIQGVNVKEIKEEKPAGYHSMEIDMNNSPKGVYFLKVEANDFIKISKAVLM